MRIRPQRGLDPLPRRDAREPVAAPIDPAAGRVVSGVDEAGLNIDAVHSNGRRAWETVNPGDLRVGRVDVVDHRIGRLFRDDLSEQPASDRVVRAVGEPEELDVTMRRHGPGQLSPPSLDR